ncbi:MAG TPA: DUF4153 domain-containing protein [Allosphingosinicella sp.]|nr:DUF4153 domain-containing protein [Allosphingosinicella sp.]
MDEERRDDHPAWPLRAAILALLGVVFGFLFSRLIEGLESGAATGQPARAAAAAFVAVSGIVFALTLERSRWRWSALFAAACGLVAGFVAGWNGHPREWGAGEGWQFFSALLAVAFAVPIFQSVRDGGRRRPDTRLVHVHVWTDLTLAGAAAAFVGATLLLTVLLAQLFHLIGIDLLRDILDESAFMVPLACGAFGGAVGLLRDRDQVLGTLHKAGRAVLSVLAPILALGLALFVAALPFTGLQPLWDQTEATTPILLACLVGAILLVNAVIGNAVDEEAGSTVLRGAAVLLALVMAPLAFVAAVSTAKRIDQYGLTPDRLWACVFVLAAAAFALAYLYAAVRGRSGWPEALRRANVRLAAGLCLLALVLALPIVSFGALSASDQLARLESGRVSPERFDWAAMRFDFGPSGRRALERLAAAGRADLRVYASRTLSAEGRFALAEQAEAARPKPPLKLSVDGAAAVPDALRLALEREGRCFDRPCRLLFAGPERAVVISGGCPDCSTNALLLDRLPSGEWGVRTESAPTLPATGEPAPLERRKVEVRTVERRQVFVDGEPVGPEFD